MGTTSCYAIISPVSPAILASLPLRASEVAGRRKTASLPTEHMFCCVTLYYHGISRRFFLRIYSCLESCISSIVSRSIASYRFFVSLATVRMLLWSRFVRFNGYRERSEGYFNEGTDEGGISESDTRTRV
jgi:hypothetical protein